jgi:predicted transcriptional regulator
LIQWLASLQDLALLEKIEELKKQALESSYELKPMSTEEYEAMIEASEEDIKEGRLYSHEEVVNYFKHRPKK